jgi:hypothetical protein
MHACHSVKRRRVDVVVVLRKHSALMILSLRSNMLVLHNLTINDTTQLSMKPSSGMNECSQTIGLKKRKKHLCNTSVCNE